MRISDWSSDVCSSDLGGCDARAEPRRLQRLSIRHRPGLHLVARLHLPVRQPVVRVGPAGLPALRRKGPILGHAVADDGRHCQPRSEEHTSELQSLMRISYAVFCLKKKKNTQK